MVAVAIDLDAQFVNRDPNHKETANEKKQRELIENEFGVPGDYRLERLYARLTCKCHRSQMIPKTSYLQAIC